MSAQRSSKFRVTTYANTQGNIPDNMNLQQHYCPSVAYPGILFGGVSTNSVEDRERGSGGGSPLPLVKGSEGSCNLVQEISFHIVKVS